MLRLIGALAVCCALLLNAAHAQPVWPAVVPGKQLSFPQDHGAHPDYKTEWWYATGWLKGADGASFGFQVTFFRVRPGIAAGNPSAFAPAQLIFAHAALSDPKKGRLLHDQRIARAGFGIAEARSGDADVRLDRWRFTRDPASGSFHTTVHAADFNYQLTLAPTAALLLQGESGYSRKGPESPQASYYYSLPQLRVTGSVERDGKRIPVTGSAWLDHEWSSAVLDPRASGWDWVGLNLNDGGALMAFQIRKRSGGVLWTAATLRSADGRIERFDGDQIRFQALRSWRSERTRTSYPVEQRLQVGPHRWRLVPLMDDQELDSRVSTGVVYWEGAVRAIKEESAETAQQTSKKPLANASQDEKPGDGQGYLELTGYHRALKL